MRILIVEDEVKIANALKKGLEQESFAVDAVHNAEDGFGMVSVNTYDLIILDRMLPDHDGMEVLRATRAKEIHAPVIFLTARDQITQRVEGLNAGADDYLVKPFAFEELLARIRALLRRPKARLEEVLRHDDLELDPSNFTVTRSGQSIILTTKEFALLEYLMRHQDRVLTKDAIINHVWDYDADVLPNTVEVFIGYLRNKIDKPFPDATKLIHTRHGFGYMFGRIL
jgi:DNA-binding response OmpR family regulator